MAQSNLRAVLTLDDNPRLSLLSDADAEGGQTCVEVQALGKRSNRKVGEIWHGFGTNLRWAAAKRHDAL